MPNQSQFPLHSPDPQTIDATLNLTQFRVEKQIYRQSTFHVKVCRIIFPLNLRKINPRGKRLFQPFFDDRKSLRSPQLFTMKFNQKKDQKCAIKSIKISASENLALNKSAPTN